MTTGHPARTGRWDEKTTLAGGTGDKKKDTPASDKDKEVPSSDKPKKS